MKRFAVLIMSLVLAAACKKVAASESNGPGGVMSIVVTSTAFTNGGKIPDLYSCRGDDRSPPLAWTGAPANTGAYALIMDDPDAPMGTWIHWVVYNIPPSFAGLPEGVSEATLSGSGAIGGRNSWGRTGYGGPCPPSGTHRYFFKLYALDSALTNRTALTKAELLAAMEGHILARGELMGTFTK